MTLNASSAQSGASLSLVDNFLSSLNSLASGSANSLGGSSLFDSLLADAKAANTASSGGVPAPTTVPTPTVSSSTTTSSGGSATDSSDPQASLKNVVSALQDLINKYRNAKNGGNDRQAATAKSTPASSSGASPSATSGTTAGDASSSTATTAATASPASPASPVATTPVAATSSAAPSASGTTASDNSSADSSTTPDLASLLAQLQNLMQTLQQQLQTLQAAAQGGTAVSVSATVGTQDLLAAGGMLGDLLKLAQAMEKAQTLNGSAAVTLGSATAATPVDPNTLLASLNGQFKTDMKAMLDALQKAAQPATANTATPASTASTATAAQTAALAAAPVSTDTATVPLSNPSQLMQNAFTSAEDMLKQLGALFSPGASTPAASTPAAAPTTAATAALTTLAAPGEDDTADSNSGTGGGNAGNNPAGAAPTTNYMAATDAGKASPYSFASQLSSARALNGGTTGLPTAVEQVMLQLSRNVKNGNDQMSLQLHPADLGRIDIKLSISTDGKVQGTVTASNPATLDMLTKDSKGLERALQDAGLTTDASGLQFSLGDSSQNARQQNSGQNKSAANDSGVLAVDPAALPTLDSASATQVYYLTPERVNMKV